MTNRITHQPREIADGVSVFLQEDDLDGTASSPSPDGKEFVPPDHSLDVGIAGARAAFEVSMDLRPEITMYSAKSSLATLR